MLVLICWLSRPVSPWVFFSDAQRSGGGARSAKSGCLHLELFYRPIWRRATTPPCRFYVHMRLKDLSIHWCLFTARRYA